ncbi:carbon-nitrogen hydrolase family protein [Shewanella sp. 202IG2-18]|uniref:carbon-nitrogen hydrolase family protein n=1 Tax=Parashewanella hymeniacidonis TaxID=2807618 RepID=UPI00196114F0|nr:carbon-nitrogen hydrolase family protein [Parashewanella hymeniacidonis]MBM7073871.1 carbon-nitrogen hydrolase family protein [Parashewanella hymeniacidonis]
MKIITAPSNRDVSNESIKVALAQLAPVFLNRDATLQKVVAAIELAGKQGCQLVTFGEALVPGYPYWVERTSGANFDDPVQKAFFAEYSKQAVVIEAGHLDSVCAVAEKHQISVYLGIVERAQDRSGHSLYCSLVYIDQKGEIQSVHRKLQPTYEERLVWSPGDGNGLRVHQLGSFTVGGLNCWENWMPLPRTALYSQGEDLHVAVWPGALQNTQDITRFIAKESRSYVLSVSGLMRSQDMPEGLLYRDDILKRHEGIISNGASCIAAPDGSWLVEPVLDEEALIVASVDHSIVREERQNFDPTGHYSRPDVTQLTVNRKRQKITEFTD